MSHRYVYSLQVETSQAVHEGIRAEGFHTEPGPVALTHEPNLPLPAPPAPALSVSQWAVGFPMGEGPSDKQWDELSNKVKRGEAILSGGLKQQEASSELMNSVVSEQGMKLKECLLQLDTLLATGRRSTWFKIKEGGFCKDGIDAKIAELADVTMKADALTKMVKNLASSLSRAEKQ